MLDPVKAEVPWSWLYLQEFFEPVSIGSLKSDCGSTTVQKSGLSLHVLLRGPVLQHTIYLQHRTAPQTSGGPRDIHIGENQFVMI